MSTLNQLRVKGGGPRFTKPAGRVLYDVRDLEKWIEDSMRVSTSDDPKGRVPGSLSKRK